MKSTRIIWPTLLLLLVCRVGWSQQQPNIILINLDDVDEQALTPTQLDARFPNMARFYTDGLRFSNAHVTTPLCGPSRCCLLQARYAHNTGSRVNDPLVSKNNGFDGGHRFYIERGLDRNDLSTWMQTAGYRTMMVGKYLNNDVVNGIPAGWDDFYSSRGNKYFGTRRYTNRQIANGGFETLPADKNRTVAEGEDVIELITTHSENRSEQPYFVYWNPLASHRTNDVRGMVEPKYEQWWPDLFVPRTANFDEADFSDKRGSLWMVPRLSEPFREFIDSHYRERLLSLLTVDDMIGQLFETLEAIDPVGNTYVILTSDNGWLNGHHRMNGKSVPFDQATRVPLYVWGPSVRNGVADHLIAHIDIGPTVVELANGETPSWVDGRSFFDVLFDPHINARAWRDPILIENWASVNSPGLVEPLDMASTALRYFDSAYIEWFNGESEYYDLRRDPYQIENRYDQLTQSRKNELARDIRAIKSPIIPEVGLIAPFGIDDRIGRQVDLQGMAEDDEGLWAVKLSIIDESNFMYWNGARWQSQLFQHTTQLTNPGGQVTKWRLPMNVPRDMATENSVRLRIWAIDLSGNYKRDVISRFRFDISPPICVIEEPMRHERVSGLFTISGTATDENEIAQIRLVIKNRDTGLFWNGNSMGAPWNFRLAMVLPDNTWKHDVELPVGRYYVSVRGIDEFGNFGTSVVSQFFIVD